MKSQNNTALEEFRHLYRRLDNEKIILNPLRYLPLYMIFNKLSSNYNLYYIRKAPFSSYFQENMNSAKEVSKSMLVKTKIGFLLPIYMALDYVFTKNTNLKQILSWHALCSFLIPYYFMNITTKLISPLSFNKEYQSGKMKFNILTFTTYFILIHLFRMNKGLIFNETNENEKSLNLKIVEAKVAEVKEIKEIKEIIQDNVTNVTNIEKEKDSNKILVPAMANVENFIIKLVFNDNDVKCVINKI